MKIQCVRCFVLSVIKLCTGGRRQETDRKRQIQTDRQTDAYKHEMCAQWRHNIKPVKALKMHRGTKQKYIMLFLHYAISHFNDYLRCAKRGASYNT